MWTRSRAVPRVSCRRRRRGCGSGRSTRPGCGSSVGCSRDRQRVNREVTLLHGSRGARARGHAREPSHRRGSVAGRASRHGLQRLGRLQVARGARLGDAARARHPSSSASRRETTELVAAAQQPDGYLNSYWQLDGRERWSDLEMGHELYCAGHLIQAGVAAARAGSPRLLAVARRCRRPARRRLRLRARIPAPTGIRRSRSRSSSSTAQTAERRYLDLADKLTSRRGYGFFAGGRFDLSYYQDAEPVRGSRSIVGHAVRALYLAAGVTDLYAETGDEALLDAMLAPVGRPRLDEDLPHRRHRLAPLRRGDRRSLRAAARPRLLRDLRGDREHHVELADAARHRREPLRRPARADALQRVPRGALARRRARSSTSNPLQSRGGDARHSLEPGRLLPAEHHAPARLVCTTTSPPSATRGVQLHQYATSTIRAVVPAAARSSSRSRRATRGRAP